ISYAPRGGLNRLYSMVMDRPFLPIATSIPFFIIPLPRRHRKPPTLHLFLLGRSSSSWELPSFFLMALLLPRGRYSVLVVTVYIHIYMFWSVPGYARSIPVWTGPLRD
ncbi:hypothetical protein BGX38DRAFT_1169236, partial [Terfezia claveryi]